MTPLLEIEALRIDTVNEIGGFRLNNYTSLIVFAIALVWFLWLVRNRPGRETVVEGPEPGVVPGDGEPAEQADGGADVGSSEPTDEKSP